MRITQLSGIFLATVMLCGSIPLGFSEPLRVQLEQGMEINEIQCDNPDNVLVQRTNGKLACVSERTADRLGWEIVETEFEEKSETVSKVEIIKDAPVEILEFDHGSDVEYVDDGREQHIAVQRAPAPWDVYDHIMEQREKHSVDDVGLYRTPATAHEKYSIQEGVGFYPEDWLPTHIPDGYKLLYIDNMYYGENDSWLRAYYVPNTFVLNENTTKSMGYDSWNGFTLSVNLTSDLLDEIPDANERSKERFENESGYVGRYLDWTRDGEPIVAHEAQTHFNHYRAILAYHYDDYTSVSIISYYMTLEEIQPVFDTVGR